MDWSALITALGSGFTVWALGEFYTQRRLERRRLYDAKLEVYAEWMAGMESIMLTWTSPKPTAGKGVKTGLLLRKLQLLEWDANALRLLTEIPKTLPGEHTAEYHWMGMAAIDPDFDWQPFREKMNALIERVRASRPA